MPAGDAFAAILGNGTVVSWGDPMEGGDSSAVHEQLKHVKAVQATCAAFAAIKEDGSVVTWGEFSVGGDSQAVQSELRDIVEIQAGRLSVHCSFE